MRRPGTRRFPRAQHLIHRSAWNKNSRKFAVASIRRRRELRASGWGYAGFLSTIVDTLAASVARNRGKLSQVVAFQLPENFRTSLSYATGFATTSVFAAAAPAKTTRGRAYHVRQVPAPLRCAPSDSRGGLARVDRGRDLLRRVPGVGKTRGPRCLASLRSGPLRRARTSRVACSRVG